MRIQVYSCFTYGTAVLGVLPLSQTLTGAASTIVSTNDIDMTGSATFSDIGIGARPLYIVCQVTTTMVGAGAYAITLQQSANAGAGAYTSIQTIGTFAAATAVGTAASYIVQPIQGGMITQRYLSLSFVLGGTVSAGAVCAFITPDPSMLVIYPRGDTISTK